MELSQKPSHSSMVCTVNDYDECVKIENIYRCINRGFMNKLYFFILIILNIMPLKMDAFFRTASHTRNPVILRQVKPSNYFFLGGLFITSSVGLSNFLIEGNNKEKSNQVEANTSEKNNQKENKSYTYKNFVKKERSRLGSHNPKGYGKLEPITKDIALETKVTREPNYYKIVKKLKVDDPKDQLEYASLALCTVND